jgi:beta-lactamase class A
MRRDTRCANRVLPFGTASDHTELMTRALNIVATPAFALVIALLTGCAGAPGTSERTSSPDSPTPVPSPAASADPGFAALEESFDARLGVYALDTGTGRAVEYRSGERFAYASTIKALAVAVTLAKTTDAELDTLVRYGPADLLAYAPITSQHVHSGMTLRELCDAAIRYSDNTAANLLLEHLGGPAALDAELTAIGDNVTQVDRDEPELNEALPGDPRDTSSPHALATSLEHFVLGDALDPVDQATLSAWLVGNTTGDDLIRAGVPTGWTVGDKTGSAGYGTRNDIAVLWPPDGAPIVLAVLSSRDEPDSDYDDALLEQATGVAIDALGR